MDLQFKKQFLDRWEKYFGGAELPVTFYYTDDSSVAERLPANTSWHCLINDLKQVREGRSLAFGLADIGCGGGKRYSGFSQTLQPNFPYFLSYGIPGELVGERYKKTPELVRQWLAAQQPHQAPGKYIVFKRFDQLAATDTPLAAIFFATPDVLSGLFTLANYEEAEPNGVIAPMGAGCSSIIHYPFVEHSSARPRAVFGMFDVSARPCVPGGTLTLSVPWPKFERMVADMDESFLITDSWKKVLTRIEGTAQAV